MTFTFSSTKDNGSGTKYYTKVDAISEFMWMIEDCIRNGGTYFDVTVDSDASCYAKEK